MKKKKNISLLENIEAIRIAAEKSNDGNRCMIAPSPDLKERFDKEILQLKKQLAGSVLSNRIKAGSDYKPVGFNDGLIYPGTMFPLGTGIELARKAASRRSLTGIVRVIVVLVDFNDKKMETDKSHFEELFFSVGSLSTGSVRDYYREVSQGKVDIDGQVVGPYRLPEAYSQYTNGASGTGSAFPNARTMARDAAIAADPEVNFAEYDNDGDGFVDAFIVIHAGTGGEMTGSPGDIWSHKWVFQGNPYVADSGTRIYGYLTVPEDCLLGVCAHELGHLLFGFPDLYDVDYSSEGIGNWCLMAGGSWNNGGLTPAHPSAWCKALQNWVTTVNQTANEKKVRIEDVKSGYKIFKLWKDGIASNEYFLAENRQKVSFDKYLPNGGLLIWHIDEEAPNNDNENHYKVALIQADGKKDLENNRNRGDDGDSYPGSTDNRHFNNSSTPNSKSYGGSQSCVKINNISDSAKVMYADFSVKCRVIKKKKKKNKKE